MLPFWTLPQMRTVGSSNWGTLTAMESPTEIIACRGPEACLGGQDRMNFPGGQSPSGFVYSLQTGRRPRRAPEDRGRVRHPSPRVYMAG